MSLYGHKLFESVFMDVSVYPGKGQLDSVSMVALPQGQSVTTPEKKVSLSSEYSQQSRQMGKP